MACMHMCSFMCECLMICVPVGDAGFGLCGGGKKNVANILERLLDIEGNVGAGHPVSPPLYGAHSILVCMIKIRTTNNNWCPRGCVPMETILGDMQAATLPPPPH